MNQEPMSRAFDLVVFDLDGTLVDAFQDITNAVNAGLTRFGAPPKSVEQVTTGVGNGLRRLVERMTQGHDLPVDDVLAEVRAYYTRHPADTATLYPGVADTLVALRARGVRLAVLSNKVEAITRSIVEQLDIARHFVIIAGETGQFPCKPAPDGLLHIMRQQQARPTRVLMVGDNDTDRDAAHAANVGFCGVTWGARNRAHWQALGVEHVIDRCEDLCGVVRG